MVCRKSICSQEIQYKISSFNIWKFQNRFNHVFFWSKHCLTPNCANVLDGCCRETWYWSKWRANVNYLAWDSLPLSKVVKFCPHCSPLQLLICDKHSFDPGFIHHWCHRIHMSTILHETVSHYLKLSNFVRTARHYSCSYAISTVLILALFISDVIGYICQLSCMRQSPFI